MKGMIRDRWRLPATLLGAGCAVWLWLGSEKLPVRPAPVPAAPVVAEPERVAVATRLAAGSRAPEIAEDHPETIEEMRQPIRLYGTARVEALYDRHDFRGVQVKSVDEGSLWDLLGFRSGDLVVEANGELVDNPAAGVQFMNSLARDVSVLVRVRGADGEERWIDFRFPAS